MKRPEREPTAKELEALGERTDRTDLVTIEELVDGFAEFMGSRNSARRLLIELGEGAAYNRGLTHEEARGLMEIAQMLRDEDARGLPDVGPMRSPRSTGSD